MCKCVNLEKIDVQYDENEFHGTPNIFFPSNKDPNADKRLLIFEEKNLTV